MAMLPDVGLQPKKPGDPKKPSIPLAGEGGKK